MKGATIGGVTKTEVTDVAGLLFIKKKKLSKHEEDPNVEKMTVEMQKQILEWIHAEVP